MVELSDDLRDQFQRYVEAAHGAEADVAFLLENLGISQPLDCSAQSFTALEDVYWKLATGSIRLPAALGSLDDVIGLFCRYLGECIVRCAGGKWVQTTEPNRRFGQPCVDGFGNKSWDRFYPVELATNFRDLLHTNPSFPGARDRKVLARQFEKVFSIHNASQR